MLNIYFGDMPSAIYNTEIYFKNTYEDSWILDLPDIHSKMPNHDLVNRDLAFSYFRNRRDKPQSVIKQHSISVQMIFLFYRWLRQMETPDPL